MLLANSTLKNYYFLHEAGLNFDFGIHLKTGIKKPFFHIKKGLKHVIGSHLVLPKNLNILRLYEPNNQLFEKKNLSHFFNNYIIRLKIAYS